MPTPKNGVRRGDRVVTITFTVTAADRRWLIKAGFNADHADLERIALCAVREAIAQFVRQGRHGTAHLLAHRLD